MRRNVSPIWKIHLNWCCILVLYDQDAREISLLINLERLIGLGPSVPNSLVVNVNCQCSVESSSDSLEPIIKDPFLLSISCSSSFLFFCDQVYAQINIIMCHYVFCNCEIWLIAFDPLGLLDCNYIFFSFLHNIYIYRVRLWCIAKHKTSGASCSYLEFESSNGRSKPLNMIFILNYVWRSNFIFFWNCLLFFRWI
jgi:hypothetical protein